MKNVCCLKRTWSTLRVYCFTRSHDGHLWLEDHKGKGILRIVAPWMLKQSLPFGIISPANWGLLVIPMSEEMETNSNKSWQNCSVEAMRNKLRPVGSFKADETFIFNPIAQLLKCHWKLSRFGYILQLIFCFFGKVVRLGNFPCSSLRICPSGNRLLYGKIKTIGDLMSLSFWGEKSRPTLWGWKMYERLRQFS